MAEAIVLALPQKEFVIDNMSITELRATIRSGIMTASTPLGCPGTETETETEIGAVLSGGRERERAAPVL
jgi:hypothetical protein